MRPFGVVLLAAGGSSRLGRPKQLLPYRGRTLVEHALATAFDSGAVEVVVVLGADAEEVGARIAGSPATLVVNHDWREGMGSSIRTGVIALSPKVEGAIVALCDQPLITSGHLRELVRALDDQRALIAATAYDGVLGAPSAFDRTQFCRLMALKSDSGARELIRSANGVTSVPFEGGKLDIDEPCDVDKLLS